MSNARDRATMRRIWEIIENWDREFCVHDVVPSFDEARRPSISIALSALCRNGALTRTRVAGKTMREVIPYYRVNFDYDPEDVQEVRTIDPEDAWEVLMGDQRFSDFIPAREKKVPLPIPFPLTT